jgi:hypothetical protein
MRKCKLNNIIMKTLIILNFLISSISFAQWQPDVRLTSISGNSFTSNNNAWCIASNGSNIHAVWFDSRDGNTEIYYKRSLDNGTTWSTDTRLTNNTLNSETPSISVLGVRVSVVWNDYRDGNWEIYYKHSTDNGSNWISDTRLTNNSSVSLNPCLAVYGANSHVVWYDKRDGNEEIYYKRSTDYGVTWGADVRLTNNSSLSYYPSVAVFSSNVHVVWHDNRDGNEEIYYKRSTDGGVTWNADIRLTSDPSLSEHPSVAVSGSVVHIVWDDARDGNWEIYYKRSTNGGLTWSPDTRLTNNSHSSVGGSVSLSGSAVHVVWVDVRDGNDEIYYKQSTDTGLTWGSDTRLTSNPESSDGPSVSVSGTAVHVLWYDHRDGNYEIYYKRNPTGNPVGITNFNSKIPEGFFLSQNYPNPFNPVTNIKFDLPKSGNVILKVYNAEGREVTTLVNEYMQAGSYTTDFDGTKIASGLYFYTIQTAGFVETKKMILIK